MKGRLLPRPLLVALCVALSFSAVAVDDDHDEEVKGRQARALRVRLAGALDSFMSRPQGFSAAGVAT